MIPYGPIGKISCESFFMRPFKLLPMDARGRGGSSPDALDVKDIARLSGNKTEKSGLFYSAKQGILKAIQIF